MKELPDFTRLYCQVDIRGKALPRCGMSAGMYREFCKYHGNKCNICGDKKGKRALAVDHCHETLHIRGLLCGKCNTGIGMLGDDFMSVYKAAKYLSK